MEYAQTHPDEFPKAADYLPRLRNGKFRLEIDKDFSKALVITQLLKHQWCLYHEAWDVIWNNTNELFLTSDNPSCLDYKYGRPLWAARYLPLAPRLALLTLINSKTSRKLGRTFLQPSLDRTASDNKVRA